MDAISATVKQESAAKDKAKTATKPALKSEANTQLKQAKKWVAG